MVWPADRPESGILFASRIDFSASGRPERLITGVFPSGNAPIDGAPFLPQAHPPYVQGTYHRRKTQCGS
jgi:hypothetical protein